MIEEIKKLDSFAERLKASREAAGFTQVQLAAEIGVGLASQARWERGAHQPGIDSLMRTIRILKSAIPGYTADVLLGT